MATKKVYDACCRAMRKNRACGWKHYSPNENGMLEEDRRPPMKKLFGHKCLVTEAEFNRCGKREQSSHLFEDELLRQHYLKRCLHRS